jgi:glycerol uptake facilitator-like aquaporin
MKDLAGVITMLIPIACGCVLPIMVVWFIIRKKMNDTNQRTQIVLAAIEKNPEMDIEEWMKKFSPKPRLLKEKLLTKLLWGSLTAMIGLGFVGFGAWLGYVGGGGSDDPMASVCIGLILLAVGIAFLVNFSVGKKMLAKEIEAEEKQVTTLPE